MSLGTASHALNLQTNVNGNKYFFATVEAGEQQLGLSTIVQSGVSTTAMTISGPAGNAVIYTVAPTFLATEFLAADEGLAVGGASTYWTPSTILTTTQGISLSSDRVAGSGVACIESYAGNGSLKGFEFLSRGLNSELLSTTSVGINTFISSIGNPGATAVLRDTGSLLTAGLQAANLTSLDNPTGAGGRECYNIDDLSGTEPFQRWSIGTSTVPTGANVGSDFTLFSYGDAGDFLRRDLTVNRVDGAMDIGNLSSVNGVTYPQNLLTSLMSVEGTAVATAGVPTLLYSHNSATTSNMIPGYKYLIDVPSAFITDIPAAPGAWLDLGIRLGGDGTINYMNTLYIPPGGLPPAGVNQGLVQICDMGTLNKDIEIIGYLQGPPTLGVSTIFTVGGSDAYMKMVT